MQLDEDNIPFSHNRIWRLTLDRFRERAEALKHNHTLTHLRTLGRGSSSPPNPAKANAALAPLASLDSDGILTYHEAFSDLVTHYSANPNPLPCTPSDNPPPQPSKPISFVKGSPASGPNGGGARHPG